MAIEFSTLCATNYWSHIDLLDTFLHIFVSIIIYDHEGQQYFATSMKDYHILQNTDRDTLLKQRMLYKQKMKHVNA